MKLFEIHVIHQNADSTAADAAAARKPTEFERLLMTKLQELETAVSSMAATVNSILVAFSGVKSERDAAQASLASAVAQRDQARAALATAQANTASDAEIQGLKDTVAQLNAQLAAALSAAPATPAVEMPGTVDKI
jgi:seryl-tRNA synthetase